MGMEFRTVLKESLTCCNIYNSFSFVNYLVAKLGMLANLRFSQSLCVLSFQFRKVSPKYITLGTVFFLFPEEFENNKTPTAEELSQSQEGERLELTQDSGHTNLSSYTEQLCDMGQIVECLGLLSITWKVVTPPPLAEVL